WSFRLAGPPGTYQFTVSADRPPSVRATRVVLNGAETPASGGVELADGLNDAAVFIALRELPKPAIETTTLSSEALVEAFKNEKVFWRQIEIAKALVERRDARVLPALASGLTEDDRHL